MPAPREISELVSRFTENLESYASDAYNEAQLPIRPSTSPTRQTGRVMTGWSPWSKRCSPSTGSSLPPEPPTNRTAWQRQIDDADRRIDPLVYELYNLTEKEGNDEMA